MRITIQYPNIKRLLYPAIQTLGQAPKTAVYLSSWLVFRQFLQKPVGIGFPVCFPIIMLYAIADQQQWNAVNTVVPRNLLKDLRPDPNGRTLEFCQQDHLAQGVEYDQIAPSGHTVQGKPTLRPDQGLRVIFRKDQMLDPVLSHPFLRCTHQMFLPQFIEDKMLLPIRGKFDGVGRQIERNGFKHNTNLDKNPYLGDSKNCL